MCVFLPPLEAVQKVSKSLLRRYTLPKFPDFGKVDYSDYQSLLEYAM